MTKPEAHTTVFSTEPADRRRKAAPKGDPSRRIKWLEAISEVKREEWNRLALPLSSPFLEWEWLREMEVSGSISEETGWKPSHLTVWSGNRLVAAAPLYIKTHSEGEFVYDYAWADLAFRLGIAYYPKLVGMSPVTPAGEYRFLFAPDEDEAEITGWMVREVERFCRENRFSGCSFLHVDPEWRRRMNRFGYRFWLHQSFAWENRGYEGFDAFLRIFKSNQRRNIRRERNAMRDLGIEVRTFAGEEIPRSFLPLMYRFYVRTNDRFGPWGCKYLTPEFFDRLYDAFHRRLVFTAAFRKERPDAPIGMALLVRKRGRLYGRYWGSREDVGALHFNVCYYGPIEWAISNGIRRFDPGIGGYHKTRRGFVSVPSYSLHRFFEPRLAAILDAHIAEINQAEQEEIDRLNRELPLSASNA